MLAHRVRVMRLYRHSLKQMASWAVQKSLIFEEFANIRNQFEANRNVVSCESRAKWLEEKNSVGPPALSPLCAHILSLPP